MPSARRRVNAAARQFMLKSGQWYLASFTFPCPQQAVRVAIVDC